MIQTYAEQPYSLLCNRSTCFIGKDVSMGEAEWCRSATVSTEQRLAGEEGPNCIRASGGKGLDGTGLEGEDGFSRVARFGDGR